MAVLTGGRGQVVLRSTAPRRKCPCPASASKGAVAARTAIQLGQGPEFGCSRRTDQPCAPVSPRPWSAQAFLAVFGGGGAVGGAEGAGEVGRLLEPPTGGDRVDRTCGQ